MVEWLLASVRTSPYQPQGRPRAGNDTTGTGNRPHRLVPVAPTLPGGMGDQRGVRSRRSVLISWRPGMIRRLVGGLVKAWRWLGDSSMERRAQETRMAAEDKNRSYRGPDSGGQVPW
jgi:hypothetical protein